jgi:hypothetical protein
MHGGKGEVHKGFWWGNLRKRDHFEDLGINVRILKWIFKKCDGAVNWINPVQDRDRWWALVNVVMNLVFHKTWEIY